MRRCSIIIQGEGRGHFSQALTAMSIMKKSDIEVARVYIGKSFFRKTPSYFYQSLDVPQVSFFSPNFLPSPDKKGIQVFFSLFLNLILAPVYLVEITRIGWLMISDKSSLLLNFYDPIGGLACKYWKNRAKKIVLSHHFYLSHPDFFHPHGFGSSYSWLMWMNRIMSKTADKHLALSFRPGKSFGKLELIPPLIGERIKKKECHPGERDLCYFLNPGFDEEIIEYYRHRPLLKADIFTDTDIGKEIPDNVKIYPTSRENFLDAMTQCKRIICTAGFDTVAEAFYLGIPVFLIPSSNHYEQYCNALDASRTGMAFQLESLTDLDELQFEPLKNTTYRNWADKAEEIFLEGIREGISSS